MDNQPPQIQWHLDETSDNEYIVTLDFRLQDDEHIHLQMNVHVTDQRPVREMKRHLLQRAMQRIQDMLGSAAYQLPPTGTGA